MCSDNNIHFQHRGSLEIPIGILEVVVVVVGGSQRPRLQCLGRVHGENVEAMQTGCHIVLLVHFLVVLRISCE